MKITYRTAHAILCSLMICALPAQSAHADAPVELLWPNGAPGATGTADIDRPSLQIFTPPADKNTGTAMVVCPGGAYLRLMSYEGEHVAEWLTSVGITAAVLKYRLAPNYHNTIPGEDVFRAIRYMRYNAKNYHFSPDRIGVIGFSAGGHLASTAATRFDEAKLQPGDPIDALSSRPDFVILAYPVISMQGPETSEYTENNLLGAQATPEVREQFTTYLHVSAKTPPVFIFHTGEDTGVPAENSLLFYSALRKNHVPAEMHIFEKGQHGLGLADGHCAHDSPKLCNAKKDPYLAVWTMLAENWMRQRGLLTPPPAAP